MLLACAVPHVRVGRGGAGYRDASGAFFRAGETAVYSLARRILRNSEDAEDVLQETFLEVVRSIGRYRGDGSLWGWIRQIAASKALMRIRREKLRATEAFDDEAGGHAPAPGGLGIDLERAFEPLSEASRAVAGLHGVEGSPHRDVPPGMGR